MKNNKKTIILCVVAIVTFAILIVGATYAYFTAQIGDGKRAEINVTTYTTDVLTFATGDAISLEADQTTFGKDKGSVNGTTYASALLTANNKTNNAVEHYYLYLNIENNTFTYSVQYGKPELIMTITDKDGNEVKNIEGLTYTEVTDRTNKKISGYDITTKNGLVTIFNNREIIAEPKAEDKWNITITFVNYEADQNANTGKVLSAKLMIQKNEMFYSLSDVCSGGETLTSCITSLSQKSVSNISKIYHHDESLANGAGDNSYRYAGGDGEQICTFNGQNVESAHSDATFGTSNGTDCKKVYTIKSDAITFWLDNSITRLLSDEKPVTWTEGACKTTDAESINIGFDSGKFNPVTEATCKGKSYLVKTDALTARVANLNMEYVGVGTWNKVNNYVCFGSDEAICPRENLYRIIGVIDGKVKLILADGATTDMLGTNEGYATTYQETNGYLSSYYKGNGDLTKIGSYKWNKTGNNTWSTSTTNTINLNTNYLTYLDSKNTKWKNMIADTTWYVVGMSSTQGLSNAKTAYNYEVGANKDATTTVTSKIGLMYVSDYYYAATPDYWTLPGFNSSGNDYRKATNDNWLYTGLLELTLSRRSDESRLAFDVKYNGFVLTAFVDSAYGQAVRPSFSLSSSITYESGIGTATDPIRITD